MTPSTYILELPAELGISSTFNAENLTDYRGHHIDEGLEKHILSQLSNPTAADQIVDVLDDQIVYTRQGGFHKFLIRWKDRPLSNASWITAANFQSINPDLYECYQAINSLESSFPRWGELVDDEPSLCKLD